MRNEYLRHVDWGKRYLEAVKESKKANLRRFRFKRVTVREEKAYLEHLKNANRIMRLLSLNKDNILGRIARDAIKHLRKNNNSYFVFRVKLESVTNHRLKCLVGANYAYFLELRSVWDLIDGIVVNRVYLECRMKKTDYYHKDISEYGLSVGTASK